MKSAATRIYWLHALSPLHVGAGRGLGHIDLPIAREKTTNWPYVPGSATKGVLADHHGASGDEARKEEKLKKIAFGLAGEDDSMAGALVFTDARLVCLPVQSLYGTFAWCTSPLVLRNLSRDFAAAAMATPPLPGGKEKASVTSGSALLREKRIYLQELDVDAVEDKKADVWADLLAEQLFPDDPEWQQTFKARFAVVDDDLFNYLCVLGTQVDARIRINNQTGIVETGGLWYEESLPAETILVGLAWCDGSRIGKAQQEELLKRYCSEPALIQVGGKATVGRGRVKLNFAEGKR